MPPRNNPVELGSTSYQLIWLRLASLELSTVFWVQMAVFPFDGSMAEMAWVSRVSRVSRAMYGDG